MNTRTFSSSNCRYFLRRIRSLASVFVVFALVTSSDAFAGALQVETIAMPKASQAFLLSNLLEGGYTLSPLPKDVLSSSGVRPVENKNEIYSLFRVERLEGNGHRFSFWQQGKSIAELKTETVDELRLADEATVFLVTHVLPDDTLVPSVGLRVSDTRKEKPERRRVRGRLAQVLLKSGQAVALPSAAHSSATVCIVLGDKDVQLGVGEGVRCDREAKRFARPKGNISSAYLSFLGQNAIRLLHALSQYESDKTTQKPTAASSEKNKDALKRKSSRKSSNPEVSTPMSKKEKSSAAKSTNADAMFRPDAAPLGSPPPTLGGINDAKAIDGDTFKNLLSPIGVRLSARAGFLARPPKNDVVVSLMAQTLNKGELALLLAVDAVLWDGTQYRATEANVFAGFGYHVAAGYGFQLDAGLLVGANFFHHGELASFADSIPGVQLAAGIQIDVNHAITPDIDAIFGFRVIGTTARGVYSGLTPVHQRLGTGAFVTLGISYDLVTGGWFSAFDDVFSNIDEGKERAPRAVEGP
ncbi:MAG: hypothetical protein GY822_02225 [Deltaproteobacteria bacterium]|nr:hypothetical protein [Deltaproteobacteria bacterium]